MFNLTKTFENDQFSVTPIMMGDEIMFHPKDIARFTGQKNLAHTILNSSGYVENVDYKVISGDNLESLKELSRISSTDSCKSFKINDLAKKVILITESGFYAACIKSRKPNCVKFRIWVTRDVIPQINKQGFYIEPGIENDEAKFKRLTNYISDLRAKEINVYRTVRDLFKICKDYEDNGNIVRDIMIKLQNAIHRIATDKTACELIVERCSGLKPNCGMNSSSLKLTLKNLGVAKNYLTFSEIEIERLVSNCILSFMELRTASRMEATVNELFNQINGLLEYAGYKIDLSPCTVGRKQVDTTIRKERKVLIKALPCNSGQLLLF